MNLSASVLTVLALAAGANGEKAKEYWTGRNKGPLKIGEHHELHISADDEFSSITPTKSSDGRETEYRISQEGAHYISIHMAAFDLPESCQMTLSDPDGAHSHEFYGGEEAQEAPFWSHVVGDAMKIVFLCDSADDTYSFEIDDYVSGYSDLTVRRNLEVGEQEDPFNQHRALSICGSNDKKNAICYATSHPTEYNHAKAVARIYINGGGGCTGWLVGNNLLMTNEHCIATQADVVGSEFEFMVEEESCSASSQNCYMCDTGVVFYGKELLAVDANLDFALIRLKGSPGLTYGKLAIDWHSMPSVGDKIYIPQHPRAWPKELGIFDTYAPGGECQIKTLEGGACGGPSKYDDYRYTCDTEGGSSGSPVLSRDSHKAVALHHCGGACGGNMGVPLVDIYDHVQPVWYPNAKDCAEGLVLVQIDFQTDTWGNETTYQIEDSSGDVIARSKSFKESKKHTIVRCLAPGQYTLTVGDTYGDGMCCSHGDGGYKLYQGGKLVKNSNGQFGSEEVTDFVVQAPPPPQPKCENTAGWRTKFRKKWKDCSWVGQKASRCLKKGEDKTRGYTGCKAECLCQENCVDNATWKFKMSGKWKKCDFVASNPKKWCGRKGSNKKYGFQACQAACSCEALS